MKRLFFLLCVALTMSTIGIALAASPPWIHRIYARDIGSTMAMISVDYRNYDQPSRVWFELSTHRDLSGARRVGERVQDPISGGYATHESLSGLTPNTVYYYRAYVKNYDGEVYSGIDSFRTTAGIKQPSVEFYKGRLTANSLELEFSCDGGGTDGHCLVMWSTSASMSGEKILKDASIEPLSSGVMMYADFRLSSVPDKTRVYFQGVMKTSVGTAKTGVHDFLIRNAPI
jgi:hypothetical protein